MKRFLSIVGKWKACKGCRSTGNKKGEILALLQFQIQKFIDSMAQNRWDQSGSEPVLNWYKVLVRNAVIVVHALLLFLFQLHCFVTPGDERQHCQEALQEKLFKGLQVFSEIHFWLKTCLFKYIFLQYLSVWSSSSFFWNTSTHISESRRIISRRFLVYWK